MKKVIIVSCFLFGSLFSQAQNIEFSSLYGYQFGSRINYYGGYLKLDDGSSFGLGAGYNTGSNYIIQLNYYRNTADVRFRDRILAPRETRITTSTIDWFSIGGTRTTGDGPNYGFIGGALGILKTTPSMINKDLLERNLESTSNFYFEFKMGGTAMLNDYIGFRAQAIVQCPIDYAGVYFGYGSGGPSSGISFNSTVVIFSLQGGLVFTLPQ